MGPFRNFEVAVFRRIRRDAPTGVSHRGAFWLFLAYFALSIPAWLPGTAGLVFRELASLDFFLLILFCIPLLWRYVFGRLLWKVRNRLIVTYLLMGLTPVVLFVTLALLLLYVFSGQFAIFAASSVVGEELTHIASKNSTFAMHIAHLLDENPGMRGLSLPEAGTEPSEHQFAGLTVAAFHDGKPIGLLPASVESHNVPSVPTWLPDDFRKIVIDHGQLWLRAANRQTLNGHTTVVITSVPLGQENVAAIAEDLGRVSIYPGVSFDDNPSTHPAPQAHTSFDFRSPNDSNGNVQINGEDIETARRHAIVGGAIPLPQHFYDIPVGFLAPLDTVDWATGKPTEVYADVTSRPTLLYKRLFSTSLDIGYYVRDGLIAIAIAFGVLELIAFLAAVRLNQTITRSVHALYEATLAIDGGNLNHRIQVKRRDQLGSLARSFNSMAASLERLLVEQREKERLQNELAIAQEVQANLFPHGRIALPMLELHGVCLPARTVSGDYYDFLLFGETGLGIALGDISGKGISAALLMATLHSAVRAYRFAGEELMVEGAAALVRPHTRHTGEQEIECGELFEEPARILALLNRHLYRSTQPEKYATLFLAHYDGITRRLVYSNGGHLPPLVLRANDTVTRLDRGGCVVGLLDDLHWEQGIEHFGPGDILIAYSDGVTEPENDFGEFGEERLLEVVRRHRHLSLEAISEQLIQTLRSWIGDQEQPDDVTLVLARQR
jgi:phosphoserine phosphatase RsbU/P